MTLVADEKEVCTLTITIDPQIISGTPVFTGTRVPIDALINNLEDGLTLNCDSRAGSSSSGVLKIYFPPRIGKNLVLAQQGSETRLLKVLVGR